MNVSDDGASMDISTIQLKLVNFLISVTGQTSINADTDLQESGTLDSLTMMDLLVFIETQFAVRLDFNDLTPEVFHSIATIARLIEIRIAKSRG